MSNSVQWSFSDSEIPFSIDDVILSSFIKIILIENKDTKKNFEKRLQHTFKNTNNRIKRFSEFIPKSIDFFFTGK